LVAREQTPQEPDLIDRIAQALPEELRSDYYRELSHCRSLPENDEMLRVLRAMQFLMVLVEQAPGQIACEREQLAQVLGRAIQSLEANHQASVAYQKQLEARLAKLPEEIAKNISAEAIAAKLTESLRQQFHQTGLPTLADAMTVQATVLRQASKQLSAALDEFSHPKTGAAALVHDTMSWMKADLKNAGDHVRAQMNGLGKELYRTIAVLCVGALALGFVMGILYHRWINAPAEAPQSPAAAMQASPQPSDAIPQNARKHASAQPTKER
jgi:hypothetical protein